MGRCLYCFKELDNGIYHPGCSRKLFGTPEPPILEYSLDELYVKARENAVASAAVPGVQPKMSMAEISDNGRRKLTFVGLLGDYIMKPPSPDYPSLPENEAATMKMAEAAGIAYAEYLASVFGFKAIALVAASLVVPHYARADDLARLVHEDGVVRGGRYGERKQAVEAVLHLPAAGFYCFYKGVYP